MGATYLSSTNYKSNMVKTSMNYEVKCCEDDGQPVLPMPSTTYCDALDPCDPQADVVKGALDDLACLAEKLLGNNRNYRMNCLEYGNELTKLRQELECCIQCKEELQANLDEQDEETQGLEMALDQETQARIDLEDQVTTIQEQLGRTNQDLVAETQEKLRMQECIDELQCELRTCCETLGKLELENQELLRNCHSHQEHIQTKEKDCCGLQEALTKCCAKVDELQQCIEELTNEINRLKRCICELECQANRFTLDMESERTKECTDRANLEAKIECLEGELKCLMEEKDTVCRKCNEIVSLHHAELDSLKNDVDNFKELYEEERKAREELEKRLKDCEEQKAQRSQQQVQHQERQEVQKSEYHSRITRLQTDCESYRSNVESLQHERNTLHGAKQCLEQQVEAVEADKVKLETELQALKAEQSAFPVTEKATFTPDKRQELTEQLQKAELDKAVIEDRNEILKLQLQKSTTEKVAFQFQNETLAEELEKAKKAKERFQTEKEDLREQLQLAEVEKERSDKDKLRYEEQLRSAESAKMNLEMEKNRLLKELESKKAEKAKEEMLHYSNQQLENSKTQDAPSKTSSSQQFVDRRELETLRADYESRLEGLKTGYKQEAEAHYRQKLLKTEKRLAEQYENSPIPEDANGNKTIPADLIALNKSLKHDGKKLRKMVRERDDHIVALQDVINEIKRKYSEQHKELRMLKIKMQSLQSDLSQLEAQSTKESEELTKENIRISRERKDMETEKLKLQDEIRAAENEKLTLESLSIMKDRIEMEVTKLKKAISQQLVDRSELEKVQAEYEVKLQDVRNQFEKQLEMNRQLAEINEYLGKQSQDRTLVDKIRDSNETLLRKELNSVSNSCRMDTEKLKKLLSQRDEEIMSLRKAVGLLKTKYATEAQSRGNLMQKVQILSTISQESLIDIISPSNNNIISRGLQTPE